MSKAIFTITHAVTAEQIAANVDAAQTKLDKAVSFYQARLADYRARTPNCDDECVRLMETRGSTPIHSMYSLLNDFNTTKDARRRVEFAKQVKPRSASINIAVIDSFDIKDQLKTKGYRFNRDGYWVDFAGINVKAAWCKSIKPDAIDSTVAELQALGCELVMDSAINSAVANIKANVAG